MCGPPVPVCICDCLLHSTILAMLGWSCSKIWGTSACGSAWLGLVYGYMIWSLHRMHRLYVSFVGLMSSWLEVSSMGLLVSTQCGYYSPCGLSNYGIYSGACSRFYFGFGYLLPSYLYIICFCCFCGMLLLILIYSYIWSRKKKKSSRSFLSWWFLFSSMSPPTAITFWQDIWFGYQPAKIVHFLWGSRHCSKASYSLYVGLQRR
jgi:hypothetical protein